MILRMKGTYMDTKMRVVALELLNQGKPSEQRVFPIPGTTRRIVVTATLVDEGIREGFTKRGGLAVVPYGSGQVCTTCGGTGRL